MREPPVAIFVNFFAKQSLLRYLGNQRAKYM